MFQKLIVGLGLLVVVLAVGIYYVSQNAAGFIKAAIEDQGSRATAVAVRVDGVDLSLTDLKAGIRGLTVANPSGFETARAVSLGEVSVKINKDWSTNLIVIDEIMVRAPEITYEIGSNGSNIAAIQSNVESFMKAISSDPGGKSSAYAEPSDSEAGPKVVISHFYIKGGKVNVSASLFKGKTMTTPLPEIHLTDIGKESGGATPAEVVDQIISAITEQSGNAASSLDLSSLGLSDISGKAAEIGGAAAEAAKGAMEGVLEGSGDAAKDAMEGAAEGVGGALKGLFGK